jgi:3-isopropylmalate/(R)-2-methylmalate dehydratase large subunit
MGRTITEKILARHSGRDEVRPGEIVMCKVDLAMANDVTAPGAADAFAKMGVDAVWDRSKIALVASHFVPAKDIASASLMSRMRAFALAHDIEHFFEIGRGGIEWSSERIHTPARTGRWVVSRPELGPPTWPRCGRPVRSGCASPRP